jgi:putative flippase GtrA
VKAESPAALIRSQFLRFALVGGAGFFVDEGVLLLAHNLIGLPALEGRIVSILCAMSFTWWGNRRITFHEHAAQGLVGAATEWLRFVAANGVGALVNYGSFALLVGFAPGPFDNPYLATAAGVGIGLVFNFTLSRALVFRARDEG